MRKLLLLAPALLLASCVTINVYFPAAEAEEAAEQFIENVMGDVPASTPAATPEPPASGGGGGLAQQASPATRWRFDPVAFFFPTAYAQERIDLSLRTPAIQAIQQRMAERFQGQLATLFDSGALGLGNDGLVVLRDASKVPLSQRVGVNQLVADDNRDRNAVYREIAVANGHPEWEAQIRATFAREWVQQARAGWWYQASDGNWKQK
jgi:uncharacterized protein YdbL (DUF1318 family)